MIFHAQTLPPAQTAIFDRIIHLRKTNPLTSVQVLGFSSYNFLLVLRFVGDILENNQDIISRYSFTGGGGNITRVKFHNLKQISKQACKKLSSHCLLQFVNNFATTCQQLVTSLLILSDMAQSCCHKADRVMM